VSEDYYDKLPQMFSLLSRGIKENGIHFDFASDGEIHLKTVTLLSNPSPDQDV
jgi:hypothetical protein